MKSCYFISLAVIFLIERKYRVLYIIFRVYFEQFKYEIFIHLIFYWCSENFLYDIYEHLSLRLLDLIQYDQVLYFLHNDKNYEIVNAYHTISVIQLCELIFNTRIFSHWITEMNSAENSFFIQLLAR